MILACSCVFLLLFNHAFGFLALTGFISGFLTWFVPLVFVSSVLLLLILYFLSSAAHSILIYIKKSKYSLNLSKLTYLGSPFRP
jgi:hypothetical protein